MLDEADDRIRGTFPSNTARPPFLLIPAIDLLGGQVVRLRHGDRSQVTVYPVAPSEAVWQWAAAGADLVHAVDLDGAFAGRVHQWMALQSVAATALAAGIECEVAGGVRDEATAARLLAMGAARVVLGTAMLLDPALARRLVERHGSARIVAALDVRAGIAVGQGWADGAPGREVDLALATLVSAGVTQVEVTAIARDGTLSGPDLALLRRVRQAAPDVTLIASGGIRQPEEISALRDLGCNGAILGRALYEGALGLADARAALAGTS
ncbi:MAG: HisA/HisF-related TIM barrel protein [Candidatus Limnocylindrales bacterium]